MSQSLEVNIKTTSDVPQAMDKAKKATDSFSKQVEDIGKKFSNSFKDIFLSFVGPMALVTGSLALISKMIADNEKKRAEANQAAIDGTNELMSVEDKYWARKRNNEKNAAEKTKQAETSREETTRQFMIFERDRAYEAMTPQQKASFSSGAMMSEFTKDPEYQNKIQALIAKDKAEDPMTNWEETQRKQKIAAERIRKEEEEAKVKAVKQTGKDTLSSTNAMSGGVIGVGANPVVIALQEQQAIQREQLAYLQIIASNKNAPATAEVTASGATPSTPANASPSRASLVTKNK
jgi:hypothetical protein